MEKYRAQVRAYLRATAALLNAMAEDLQLENGICQAAQALAETYKRGNRVFIIGNGGSAGQAQHFAAELVGYFNHGDKSLSAFALTTDTSFLTAWVNDDDAAEVFARQLEAHAREGDTLVAISTSGTSSNVLHALRAAGNKGVMRIAIVGEHWRSVAGAEVVVTMHSRETPRIQEAHMVIIHVLCKCL